ncbi:MAG: hypothetical protein ABGZ17_04190 [Planctomycetaceae bacterium]
MKSNSQQNGGRCWPWLPIVCWLACTALLPWGAFGQATESQPEIARLRVPPTEPSQALQTFRLQPGFRMELVACEPLIRDPVALDFDEFGRMYVVEYPEFNAYSFGEGETV